MTRIVVLPDWTDREAQPAPPQAPRPQWSGRLSLFSPRYPNAIRRYRLEHSWRQRDVAGQVGCRPSTVGGWERGKTMPRGPWLLRLARVLDTLVESLYYDLYTAEKFFVLPSSTPIARQSIPLTAPLELPPRARVVSPPLRSLAAWHRQLDITKILENTVRARHAQSQNSEPMWVPIRRAGRFEPYVVPYVAWDSSPAVAKSLLMTVRWMRRYAQAKGRQSPSETTRLAYEGYLRLFVPHEQALKRKDRGVRI